VPALAAALGAHSLAELRLGRPDSALSLAERGLETASRASYPHNHSRLRLARAEALRALGRHAEACMAIAEARDAILRVAATLADPALQDSYLNRVCTNARTLKLAFEWLGEQVS
jgi:tetratricopeptide (TPR) repeat protein